MEMHPTGLTWIKLQIAGGEMNCFILLQVIVWEFFGTSSCHRAGSSAGFRSRAPSTVHESGHLHTSALRLEERSREFFLAKQPDMHARHAASLAWLFVFEPGFSLVGSAIKLTPCCLPASDGGFIPFGQSVWESANANSLEFIGNPHLVMF